MYDKNNLARLIISCPDKKGIVAAVSGLLYKNNANITESAQHSTPGEKPQFFMRIVFEIQGLMDEKKGIRIKLEKDLKKLSKDINMSYGVSYLRKLKRMAILVSRMDHCLNELLWLWKSGDIEVEIPLICSNHEDLKELAEFYKIPYFYIPVKDGPLNAGEGLKRHERKLLSLLEKENIDFITLARYMRILSPGFLKSFNKKIINIHHSFLPSFPGAKPYEKAYEKGVKIIGATAHFVNDELDAGPIIEQDIIRIDHDDDIDEMKRKGKIIEKNVLSRAVKWFSEDRIIEKGNRTIVFT